MNLMRFFIITNTLLWLNIVFSGASPAPQVGASVDYDYTTIVPQRNVPKIPYSSNSSSPSELLARSTLSRRATAVLERVGTHWTDADALIIKNIRRHGTLLILGHSEASNSRFLIGAKWDMPGDRAPLREAIELADHILDSFIRIHIGFPEEYAFVSGPAVYRLLQERFPGLPRATILAFHSAGAIGHPMFNDFRMDIHDGAFTMSERFGTVGDWLRDIRAWLYGLRDPLHPLREWFHHHWPRLMA